jgi:predicted ferric reductase
MSAVDLSSFAGLGAMLLITVNILLGILISTRYNPRRQWPHRKINVFKLHNWTAYTALAMAFLHPSLLLLSTTAKFRIVDVLLPLNSPGQRNYNILGATTFYLLIFVVVTSYFRLQLGRRIWKPLHYLTYVTGAFLFIHGTLIDPNLKNLPTDFLDGEKLLIEGCCAVVIAASIWRLRATSPRDLPKSS